MKKLKSHPQVLNSRNRLIAYGLLLTIGLTLDFFGIKWGIAACLCVAIFIAIFLS